MKCTGFQPGRRWLVALGVLIAPPAAWIVLIALLPTDCARRKIVERVGQATGRAVGLGRVRVGAFGGVTLGDLTIGAPATGEDPWLEIAEATINVGPLSLARGRVEPSEVDVRGLRLRILRRRDGTLELADLLRPSRTPHTADAAATSEATTALNVRFRDATLIVVDEPTGTRIELTGVEGRAILQGRLTRVTEFRGALNGGTVELAAQLDRSESVPRFEGQVKLRDVAVREGMRALAYLLPVIADAHADLEGTLALDLYLRGQGSGRAALRRTLVGHGRAGLDPVQLEGSRLLAGLNEVVDLPSPRAGDVWADFTVKDGQVATDNLTINVARLPLLFAGSTDFDGRVNYRLRVEGAAATVSARARELLAEWKPDLKVESLTDVRIEGTVNNLVVLVNGVPMTPPASSPPVRRSRTDPPLRALGRRLLEALDR